MFYREETRSIHFMSQQSGASSRLLREATQSAESRHAKGQTVRRRGNKREKLTRPRIFLSYNRRMYFARQKFLHRENEEIAVTSREQVIGFPRLPWLLGS
jgi:hypothetical protein